LQNDSYSLSIVKKLTAGKERWTITKTDGGHTDIGVISEEVEKLTLKSDISTIKPTRIVTPDESAVVFEMLLRKSRLHNWKPTYDVTDGAGLNIGVVYKDVKASVLHKKCVIETQSGRWRLAETSSSRLIVRLTAFFATTGAAGVLTALEYNGISGNIKFVVFGIVAVVVRVTSVKMHKKALLLTLENESGVQVGSTTFVNGGYDIQVQDQRLDQRVAVAAGLITADYTDS
jgi:hypothetical protein